MACFFHITVYGEHLSMLQKYISTTFKIIAMCFIEGVHQNLLNQFPITGNLWDFPPQFCYYKWNPSLFISLGWISKIESYVHFFFRFLIHTSKFTSRRLYQFICPLLTHKNIFISPQPMTVIINGHQILFLVNRT